MILEEVTQSVLAIVATALIMTAFTHGCCCLGSRCRWKQEVDDCCVFLVGRPDFCPCDCVLGRELMEVQRCCWKP